MQAGGENRASRAPLNGVPSFPALSLCQAIHVDPCPTLAPLVIWLPPPFRWRKGGGTVGSHCAPQAQEELRFASRGGFGRERETPERCHPLQRFPQGWARPTFQRGPQWQVGGPTGYRLFPLAPYFGPLSLQVPAAHTPPPPGISPPPQAGHRANSAVAPQGIKGERGYTGPAGEKGESVSCSMGMDVR